MTKTMEALLSKSAKLRDLHAQLNADDGSTESTRSVVCLIFWIEPTAQKLSPLEVDP